MDNYICIGDIHGRLDLLELLLEKVANHSHPESLIVFMGDMVDRGPDSYGVVAKVKSLCEKGSAIALTGNHEGMMLDYHRNKIVDKLDIWLINGGHKTIKSYQENMGNYGMSRFFSNFERSGHAEWMRHLPYFYETEKVWFSHAPIPSDAWIRRIPYVPAKEGDFRANQGLLTWTFIEGATEGTWERDHGKLAVCGHVHRLLDGIALPRIYPHIIYSDSGSGCWDKAPLSAIFIEDGKYKEYITASPGEVE